MTSASLAPAVLEDLVGVVVVVAVVAFVGALGCEGEGWERKGPPTSKRSLLTSW
jgi:hypothetical protein